jgi:hypothetical protein
MNIPAADHPIWKIIRLAVVGVIMFAICWSQWLYKSEFDIKDAVFIATTLFGLAGYDVAKAKLTKEPVE